jgi:hypothetical protein
MVPERTQRFIRVAGGRGTGNFAKGRIPCVDIGVVIVFETERIEQRRIIDRVDEINRIAVALKRGMGVVQVGRDLGNAKAVRRRLRDRRQLIVIPHQC